MAQYLGLGIVLVLVLLGLGSWLIASRPARRPALGAVLLVVVAAATACPALPPQVDEVTVVNGTEYDIDVMVSDEGRDGWLPVGRAVARSERVTQGVIDQGEIWVFRFSHEGDVVGELLVERSTLEGSGWRIEIPEEIGDRLGRRGLDPST